MREWLFQRFVRWLMNAQRRAMQAELRIGFRFPAPLRQYRVARIFMGLSMAVWAWAFWHDFLLEPGGLWSETWRFVAAAYCTNIAWRYVLRKRPRGGIGLLLHLRLRRRRKEKWQGYDGRMPLRGRRLAP